MAKYITLVSAEFEDKEGNITTRSAGVHVFANESDVVNDKLIVEFVDEVAAIPLKDLVKAF